ncbi:MAG: nucleotide-binding protein [Xanthobacteraceae bacterium]
MSKVFIAYGSDHTARDAVSDLLKSFGLHPVIFSKTPDHTKAVIEKFEHSARQCEFAIIILNPDDKRIFGKTKKTVQRARQNVIFEMGWFFGRLDRRKTLLLRKGTLELPSDIRGVLYKQYKKTPLELKGEIASALKAGGIRLGRRR